MSKLKGEIAPKSSNKNPYELRLEILYLAQSIVDRRTENDLQLLHLQSDSENELLGEDTAGFKNSSVDEVLMIAKKLNYFVSHG